MKLLIMTSTISLSCIGLSSAQVLGSYDFHGSDQNANGGLETNPALSESLKATYVSDTCINLSSIKPSNGYTPQPRTWSTNTKNRSSTTSPTSVGGNGLSGDHANCFGGWTSNYSSSRVVQFDLTFNAAAIGQVDKVKMDIGNYGYRSDPSLFRFSVLKNGSQVYSTTRSITSKWVNQSFDLSAANLTSAVGNSDVITFRIGAYGGNVDSYGTIALDNIDILGKHKCVPEPSSTALLGLGAMGMLLRRRR